MCRAGNMNFVAQPIRLGKGSVIRRRPMGPPRRTSAQVAACKHEPWSRPGGLLARRSDLVPQRRVGFARANRVYQAAASSSLEPRPFPSASACARAVDRSAAIVVNREVSLTVLYSQQCCPWRLRRIRCRDTESSGLECLTNRVTPSGLSPSGSFIACAGGSGCCSSGSKRLRGDLYPLGLLHV